MLRVTTLYASSAVATAAYYTRYLAQAPGEEPGVWSGRQAEGLGLAGEVEADDLQRLLEGRDPANRDTARQSAGGSGDGERVGGAGGGGVRCDVLGAEVGERVVGADRRPGSARGARRRCRRGARASGAVRGDDPGAGRRPPSAPGHGRVVGGDVPPDDVAGR